MVRFVDEARAKGATRPSIVGGARAEGAHVIIGA